MGGLRSGSMRIPGLVLALLLALAVVSAVSLRLEPESRREKQLDERRHRECESDVGRRREADDEDRRRDVEHRRREDDDKHRRETDVEHRRREDDADDDKHRRDIERRRRDDEEDKAERRREVERRRDLDYEERRREEDDERRRDDDGERRREVERRRRDDEDDKHRREMERRHREGDDDEERRREVDRRRRDDEDDERRRELERRHREGDYDEERRREVERHRRDDVGDERRRDVQRRREDDDEERRRREADRRRRDDADDDDERRRESDRRRRADHGEKGLLLGKPQKQLSTEGGDIRVWPQIRPLEDSEVYCQAARITLRERGMLLPQYADSATVYFVEEGEGLVGLLSGYSLGEKARRVRHGDVVAIPKGLAQWWYNTGNQDLRIIALADTSFAIHGDRDYTPFALVGGRGEGEHGEREAELGSILHGFRKEFLAEAWDADESEVEEVLYSQKGVGIIKVERDVDIESAVNVIDDSDVIETKNVGQGGYVHSHLSEFVYNVRHGTPDILVEGAGFFTAANRLKLPLLSSVKLGLTHGRLQRDAIFAPHWSPNGHQIVHILRGTGYFEIAGPGGIKLLNEKVKEGDVIVIPRFHAAGMKAEDELEWVTFYTTDMPYVEALAGKTSVYKNLPTQVAAAAFNLDEDRVREFRKHRLRDALLLPGGRQSVHRRRDDM